MNKQYRQNPLLTGWLLIALTTTNSLAANNPVSTIETLQTQIITATAERRTAPVTGTDSIIAETITLLTQQQKQTLPSAAYGRLIARLQDSGLLSLAGKLLRARSNSSMLHPAQLRQARLLLNRGDLTAAAAALPKTRNKRWKQQVLSLQAAIAYAAQQPQQALQLFKKIDTPTPFDRYLLAQLYQNKSPAQSMALLEGIISDTTATAALREHTRITLAQMHFNNHRYKQVITILQHVSSDSVDAEQALYLLGRAQWQNNHPRQAIRHWDAAISRLPVNPFIANALLALPYALAHIAALDEAVTRYRDAIKQLTHARKQLALARQQLQQSHWPTKIPAAESLTEQDFIDSIPGGEYVFEEISNRHFQDASTAWRRLQQLKPLLKQLPATESASLQHRWQDQLSRLATAMSQQLATAQAEYGRFLDDSLLAARYGLARMLDQRSKGESGL